MIRRPPRSTLFPYPTLFRSASTSLPLTRTNLGDRNLFLGFSDTVTFGSASPFILTVRGQYRDEPTLDSPAHPQAGPNTTFNLFSSFTTGGVFGDQGQFSYGATFTPSTLEQKYEIFGASLAKTVSRHTLKFGWDFERTHVDGVEANGQNNQLFATQADRKSTRLNSSHSQISYAVFCLKKKKNHHANHTVHLELINTLRYDAVYRARL